MSKVLYDGQIIESDADVIDGKTILKTEKQFNRREREEESRSYHKLKAESGIGYSKWVFKLPGGKPGGNGGLTPWNMHLPDNSDQYK